MRSGLLIAGVALIFYALPTLEIVRGHHAELQWLRDHTTTQTYVVTELGIARADGTATTVFVSDPGHPDAFVDLRYSTQRIRTEGEQVRARVDHRIRDAVGTGVGDDAVDHGFLREYLRAGSPILLAVMLFGLALAMGRTTRVDEWGDRQRRP